MHRRLQSAIIVVLLSLASGVAAGEEVEPLKSTNAICRQAALIAHVRMAGKLPQRHAPEGEQLWLAEIIDAAQGPAAGQLALIEVPDEHTACAQFRRGAALLLFASRTPLGLYRPLDGRAGCWPIDGDGKLQSHPLAALISPVAHSHSPADVAAWWKNEARQRTLQISLAIDAGDLRTFKPQNPLRLAIAIDNTGGQAALLNNCIEFEYSTPGDERKELRAASQLPAVKIFAQPLSREHSLADLAQILHQVSELTLAAGQRCVGEYDLSQEPQIYGGMRYQIWAEVGASQSAPLMFELPGGPEAMELEKLAEIEDDGPLHVDEHQSEARPTMPLVQPTDEAQAIDAALSIWLASAECAGEKRPAAVDGVSEVMLLRRANLPLEFCSSDSRHRFIVADGLVERPNDAYQFELSGGRALFRGRALRVERVVVQTQTAIVELSELEEEQATTGAIIRLRRDAAAWRSAGEIELQQR